MTLNELSVEAARVTGSGLGFGIKSLAHPDRKFRVCYKMGSGKFAITRLDTGTDYFVSGSEDRYAFSVPINRIGEVRAELSELSEQKTVIETRIGELTNVLDGLGG